jgi:cell wall assembly regulator SMI1
VTAYHELSLADLTAILFRLGLPRDVLAPGGAPAVDVPPEAAEAYRIADGLDGARWRERWGSPPLLLPSLEFPSEGRAQALKDEFATSAAATGSPWQDSWWPVLVAAPDHVLCVDGGTGHVWNVDWGSGVVEPIAPTLGTYWAGCAYFLDSVSFDAAAGTWGSLPSGDQGPWNPVQLGMDGPLPVVAVDDWRDHSVAETLERILSVHRTLDSGVHGALRPPVSPGEVARVEALLGLRLHPQVLELYSIADGLGNSSRVTYGPTRLLPWLRFPPLGEVSEICRRSRDDTTTRFGAEFWRPGWFPVLDSADGPGIYVDCATTQGTAWRVMWNADDVGAPRVGDFWRRPVAPSLAAYLLWCGRRLERMDLFVDTDGQVRARDYLDDMFTVDDYGFGPSARLAQA